MNNLDQIDEYIKNIKLRDCGYYTYKAIILMSQELVRLTEEIKELKMETTK
jgi:hypothetical protein